MIISFELDDHEDRVTPIMVADALISSDQFDREQIKELIAYLSVFTRYNEDFDPNLKYNRKPDVLNMKLPEKRRD